MASHTYHPDTHQYGLAEGCPRCEEHAEHPLTSLDEENITMLRLRVLEGWRPRSENERKAMEAVRASGNNSSRPQEEA